MTTWKQIYPVKTVAGSGNAFTDTLSLRFNFADDALVATDSVTFNVEINESESALTATESASLSISGTGINDLANAATETSSVALKVWLSGSAGTGVTNPSNADGQNNGTVATLQTTAAGSASKTMLSAVGANIPAFNVSGAVYRGWFSSVNTLTTSNTRIILSSTTAQFVSITMFSNSALNSNVNNLNGGFTFDLFAAGINTLAKLRSCQITHETTDQVAGVTPAVFTVDAGAIELTGRF